MKTLADECRKIRGQYPQANASLALSWARESIQNEETRKAWDGETVGSERELENLDSEITVALLIRPDEYSSAEDLLGTMFDPEAHPEIPARQLARERELYLERIAREGVWGIIACHRGPDGEWIQGDSCWGFEGSYVKEASHEFMRSAMEARDKVRDEARELGQFAEEVQA